MTKYYVYSVKTDNPEERIHAFVEDPVAFAVHQFDPAKMEFTGVFVEASDPQKAHEIYMHPGEDDIFVSCDEPRPTELKRQAREAQLRLMQTKLKALKEVVGQAEIEAGKLRVQALIFEIAQDLNHIATQASELARQIRITTKTNQFTNEQIYEKLIEKYVEQFSQLRYRPGLSGTVEG